jgi:hypothetical protein
MCSSGCRRTADSGTRSWRPFLHESDLVGGEAVDLLKDDFAQMTIKDFVDLPFPKRLDSDGLAALADTMLTLHKRLAAEQLPNRRGQIQREIDATDRRIDQLV